LGGWLAVIGAVLGLLAAAASAAAATYTVTTTADTAVNDANCQPASCSLRQAITKTVGGDTVIVPASTSPYLVSNGQLTVSTALTIRGAGASASVIQATAGNQDRVMLINGNSAPVRLEGLTITGGVDATLTTEAGGGGIAAVGPGPVVLDDVDVVGNTVDTTNAGAGPDQGGGGIFTATSMTLTGSTVSNNHVVVAQSQGDGGGGGILATGGNLTITDSSVSANTAEVSPDTSVAVDNNGGGGVYMDGQDLTVTGSAIQGNTAMVTAATSSNPTPADGGGGIYQFGDNFRLQDSTVSGNVAHGPGLAKGGGGGIFDDGDTSQYLNSTITGNSTDEPAATNIADSDGGGGVLLDNVKGGVAMANMTITANRASAATGGGINNHLISTVDVTNSIIAANTASDADGNCSGAIDSDGYNLTDDPASANTCALTATGDVVDANPVLGPLQDNGGPTPTEALLAGSPAIDAGDPAGCTNLLGNPLSTDQRGVSRPQPAAGRCDIGAYERALPVVINGAAAVTGTSVVFDATAGNPDPGVGSVSVQYGPTAAYGRLTAAQPLAGGAVAQPFSASVSGLAPGTYHFRATATDPDGTAVGSDGVFTIAAPRARRAPAVTTRRATDVGAFFATLAGVVNAEGQTTKAYFDYGTTRRYGSRTPSRSIGAGTVEIPVLAALSGLKPGRTYHVRVVASNAAGTSQGIDVTFRTTARPKPSGFTATVKPRAAARRPFTFRISGRLSLPPGLARAVGCRGSVTVRGTIGRTAVASARTTIGRACGYRLRVTLHGRLLGRSGRVRLTVRFQGNAVLKARPAAPLLVRLG
jgi:CSLREA domain-containing protein